WCGPDTELVWSGYGTGVVRIRNWSGPLSELVWSGYGTCESWCGPISELVVPAGSVSELTTSPPWYLLQLTTRIRCPFPLVMNRSMYPFSSRYLSACATASRRICLLGLSPQSRAIMSYEIHDSPALSPTSGWALCETDSRMDSQILSARSGM